MAAAVLVCIKWDCVYIVHARARARVCVLLLPDNLSLSPE